ncbi:MAG: hypothetical protein FD189_930 [Elusimicrobia bacterium]|nr:MAG: hypothetical protein FD154_1033 [Elusimicrobiota bacterium]KAF0156585.1 MAG: hypothetical protein FD189_930 [Elusimicrobiota bacterium]
MRRQGDTMRHGVPCGGRVGKIYRLLLKAFGPQGWWPVAELPAPTAGNAALIRPVAELGTAALPPQVPEARCSEHCDRPKEGSWKR